MRVDGAAPPAFYRALSEFNAALERQGARPLLLLQGLPVAPEEYTSAAGLNLTEWVPDGGEPPAGWCTVTGTITPFSQRVCARGTEVFSPQYWQASLDRATAAVRAVHGAGGAPSVAKYVLGFVLGPGWLDRTVNATNVAYAGLAPYKGTYVQSADDAAPFETWLAMVLDAVAAADVRAGWQHPLAVASSAALDPLTHPLDAGAPTSYDDWVSVDARRVTVTAAWTAGAFVALAAPPPGPPRFLTLSPAQYAALLVPPLPDAVRTTDDPYAAYLELARAAYPGALPILVTDLGVPATWGGSTAGDPVRGRMGGLTTEARAGEVLAGVIDLIANRSYAGVVLAALTDSWHGVSANTDPLHRRPNAWADVLTAGTGLGVIAVEPPPPVYVDGFVDDWDLGATTARRLLTFPPGEAGGSANAPVSRIGVGHDAAFVYLFLERAAGVWSTADEALVSLDSVPGQGSSTWLDRPNVDFGHPADLLVHFVNGTVTAKVGDPREDALGHRRPADARAAASLGSRGAHRSISRSTTLCSGSRPCTTRSATRRTTRRTARGSSRTASFWTRPPTSARALTASRWTA